MLNLAIQENIKYTKHSYPEILPTSNPTTRYFSELEQLSRTLSDPRTSISNTKTQRTSIICNNFFVFPYTCICGLDYYGGLKN